MDNVRPVTLKDVIGQETAVQNCDILVKSAKLRNAPLPHILFSGPAGTGKTTLARAIAEERGTKLYIANGGGINSVKKMLQYLLNIQENEIIFIDEIHRLPIPVCEFLYPVMEDFRYDITDPEKQITSSIKIKPFTMLGATTILGKMPKPLRDRFKHKEELRPYTIDELTDIVKRIGGINNINLSDEAARTIAQTCRANPRKAVNRTEWIRDYILSQEGARRIDAITPDEILEAIALQGVGPLGLEKNDRRYLEELDRVKEASLNYLSSKLNLDRKTIQEDIEPYLIQLGMVRIGTKGRYIIPATYQQYVEQGALS